MLLLFLDKMEQPQQQQQQPRLEITICDYLEEVYSTMGCRSLEIWNKILSKLSSSFNLELIDEGLIMDVVKIIKDLKRTFKWLDWALTMNIDSQLKLEEYKIKDLGFMYMTDMITLGDTQVLNQKYSNEAFKIIGTNIYAILKGFNENVENVESSSGEESDVESEEEQGSGDDGLDAAVKSLEDDCKKNKELAQYFWRATDSQKTFVINKKAKDRRDEGFIVKIEMFPQRYADFACGKIPIKKAMFVSKENDRKIKMINKVLKTFSTELKNSGAVAVNI